MSEYEIALLDYGEKRGFWKYVKRDYVREARMRLDFFNNECFSKESFSQIYKELRDDETFGEPSILRKAIVDAWCARCRVMMHRKECHE